MFRDICFNKRINSIIRASLYSELLTHIGETVECYTQALLVCSLWYRVLNFQFHWILLVSLIVRKSGVQEPMTELFLLYACKTCDKYDNLT